VVIRSPGQKQLLLVGLLLCASAGAQQAIKSADGKWSLKPDAPAALEVKKENEVMVDISAIGGAAGQCPTVDKVAFTMPTHGGHGGASEPEVMKMGACGWHISNLTPTMKGPWQLRLTLKSGDKSTTADLDLPAQ
jgi:hypothetical protein